jgi:hypothetical protein
MYRLEKRLGASDGVGLGLSCDEAGLRLAGECVLIGPDADNEHWFRVSDIEEINRALSAGYGADIDLSSRLPALERLAKLMSEGKWGLAGIAALQLRLPPLPDEAALARLRKVEQLLRGNPYHLPAGPGGGQFTSGPSVGGQAAGGAQGQAASSQAANANPVWTRAGTIDEKETASFVGGNQLKVEATSVGIFPMGQGFMIDAEAFGMEADAKGKLRVIPNAGPIDHESQTQGGLVFLPAPQTRVFTAKVPSPSGVYTWTVFRNVTHEDEAGPDAEADVNVTVYVNKPAKQSGKR